MKNINDLKKYIPNILTIIRIILTPIIIIVGILKHTKIVIALITLATLTDLLDGVLARKWKVTSLTGAKLDAVADKLFAISIIGCLITTFKILWIPFILEIILGLTNLYYHLKNNKTNSLMIGKIKTVFLFITMIIGIITTFYSSWYFLLRGMVYATINLQILSLIKYAIDYFNPKEKITIENNGAHRKIMEELEETDEIDKTLILKDLQKLAEEFEYNNETDDID